MRAAILSTVFLAAVMACTGFVSHHSAWASDDDSEEPRHCYCAACDGCDPRFCDCAECDCCNE